MIPLETIPIQHGANSREYVVLVPSVPNAPLVLFLHGMGCTAAWAVDETRLDQFARQHGFALVAPQALRPRPDEPAKFLTNAPRWNDGLQPDQADDVAFLDAVLTDALRRTQADPQRVAIAGFSNGAAMTFRYAAECADRIAAMAPVAGHCWITNPKPTRPIPTLYLIGSRDPLVPLRGGAIELPWGNRLVHRPPVLHSLELWAAALGCSPKSRITRDGPIREEQFPGPVDFRAITVDGLGHHWPGGKGQLNPRIGGPQSSLLNANELLWEFFQNAHSPRTSSTHHEANA